MSTISKSIWRMASSPDGISVSIDAHDRGEKLTPRSARSLAIGLLKAADAVEAKQEDA